MKRKRQTQKKKCNRQSSRARIKDGSSATATESTEDKKYAIILELVLPFLNIADDCFFNRAFAKVSMVNKDFNSRCAKLLIENCEKYHPVLLGLIGRNNTSPDTDKLTYWRFQQFLSMDVLCEEGRITPNAAIQPPPFARTEVSRLDDYEVALEITKLPPMETFTSNYPSLSVFDIQPLTLDPNDDGDDNDDDDEQPGPELYCEFKGVGPLPTYWRDNPHDLRIRVLIRNKTTGKLAMMVNDHIPDKKKLDRPFMNIRYAEVERLAAEPQTVEWHYDVWLQRLLPGRLLGRARASGDEDPLPPSVPIVDFIFGGKHEDFEGSDDENKGVVDLFFRAMDTMKWF